MTKDNKKVLRKFSKYLKEEGCFGSFLYIIAKRPRHKTLKSVVETSLNHSCMVDEPFVWSHTKQGFKFWQKIHSRWFYNYKEA